MGLIALGCFIACIVMMVKYHECLIMGAFVIAMKIAAHTGIALENPDNEKY
jgi:hypothetical protein